MADSKTTYLENAMLNHILRNTAMTPPATVYLALLTSDPGEPGSVSEVSGGSYARQVITFNAPTNGSVTNAGEVAFNNMPGVTVTHVAIMDALTGGNVLYYKELPSATTVNAGNELSWDAGLITVSEA